MKTQMIWEQLVGKGLEHLVLEQDKDIRVDSLAVGRLEGTVYRIRYQIICDAGWKVKRVEVEDLLSNKTLVFLQKEEEFWTDEQGHPIEALAGCSDVDIMITPFTNTLPIRRLRLAPGQSKKIAVVYFGLPNLTVSKLDQRYTFLSQEKDHRVYKYESLGSGFTSDITVDADGFVIDYPGIFRLVWKEEL